jgi:hypothetical protein
MADVLVVTAFKFGNPLVFGVERVADNFSLHPGHSNSPRRFCDGPAMRLDRPRNGNGNFVTRARLNLGLASMMRDGQAKARPNEPDDFMSSVPPNDRCECHHLPSLRSYYFPQRFAHRHRAFVNVGDLGLVCSFAALVVNTVQATRDLASPAAGSRRCSSRRGRAPP